MKNSVLNHKFTLKQTGIIFIVTFTILQVTAIFITNSLNKQITNLLLDCILFGGLFYYKYNKSRIVKK